MAASSAQAEKEQLKARIRDYKRTHAEYVYVDAIASALDVDPVDCLRAALELVDEDNREMRIVYSRQGREKVTA